MRLEIEIPDITQEQVIEAMAVANAVGLR